MRRASAWVVGGVGAILAAQGARTDTPDLELQAALERYHQERAELNFDALDPGELEEHAALSTAGFEDPALTNGEVFVFGDSAFEVERSILSGYGNALPSLPGGGKPRPNIRRLHRGDFGGPDASSCVNCHARGGLNGAGTRTQNALFLGDGENVSTALERNPPHVLGLGVVQALAQEMSLDLQAAVNGLSLSARQSGTTIEREIVVKGVGFGVVKAFPDGTVALDGLTGVDEDLTIKPFGWKGNFATMRLASDQALSIHLGLQSSERIERAALLGDAESVGSEDPFDPDMDGITGEIGAGGLGILELYLAMLEIPIVAVPEDPIMLDAWARGAEMFELFACANCHATLHLANPVQCLGASETFGGRCLNVVEDGESPRPSPFYDTHGEYPILLFSDLRRHDMGEALAEPKSDHGVPGNMWLTRPLWGLADTAPYLHDGRAADVDEAILLHGGEATAARDAYAEASEADKGALRVFLMSLTREIKLEVQ